MLEKFRTILEVIMRTLIRQNSIAGGILSSIPELGCIALLLVCAGWQDELRLFDNMVRIGSYIRIILEPKIPGLRWETAINLIDTSQKKMGFTKRLVSALFTTYGVFLITSVSFSLILFFEFPPPSFFRAILFFTLFLIGLIFSVRVIGAAMNFREKGRIWDEKFSKISEQSKPPRKNVK